MIRSYRNLFSVYPLMTMGNIEEFHTVGWTLLGVLHEEFLGIMEFHEVGEFA